jgi:hypothetical protein
MLAKDFRQVRHRKGVTEDLAWQAKQLPSTHPRCAG